MTAECISAWHQYFCQRRKSAGRPERRPASLLGDAPLIDRSPAAASLRASADVTDPFLVALLFRGCRLRGKLQYGCRLALAQQCQQHDAPVRKLDRVVMRGHL